MSAGLQVVLVQPDRPHNLGAVIRLCACLGAGLHVVEPCGFAGFDRRIREAALDYLQHMEIRRHADSATFVEWTRKEGRRLVLMTTAASTSFLDFEFHPRDLITIGNERVGAAPLFHEAADARLAIPLAAGRRSLNLAAAATLALGEAMRQTHAFDRLAVGRNSGRMTEMT